MQRFLRAAPDTETEGTVRFISLTVPLDPRLDARHSTPFSINTPTGKRRRGTRGKATPPPRVPDHHPQLKSSWLGSWPASVVSLHGPEQWPTPPAGPRRGRAGWHGLGRREGAAGPADGAGAELLRPQELQPVDGDRHGGARHGLLPARLLLHLPAPQRGVPAGRSGLRTTTGTTERAGAAGRGCPAGSRTRRGRPGGRRAGWTATCWSRS
jgi:hypothetical protein